VIRKVLDVENMVAVQKPEGNGGRLFNFEDPYLGQIRPRDLVVRIAPSTRGKPLSTGLPLRTLFTPKDNGSTCLRAHTHSQGDLQLHYPSAGSNGTQRIAAQSHPTRHGGRLADSPTGPNNHSKGVLLRCSSRTIRKWPRHLPRFVVLIWALCSPLKVPLAEVQHLLASLGTSLSSTTQTSEDGEAEVSHTVVQP
jgi:hypothetical protein